MHDLGSTDCTQATLCGCTRPERANGFMLHVAAYVMHCSSSRTAMHCGAACSPSQVARGHVDAWPAWHRLNTSIAMCVP